MSRAVQIPHQAPEHAVAGEQQRRRRLRPLAAGLALALLGAAAPAAAAEPEPARPASYGAALGLAYAAAPLLALGVGGLLSEAEADDSVAVLAAAPMFLLPAAVHLYQGDRGATARAGFSLATLLGMTFGGTLAGGVGGYVENAINCDPDTESECDDRGIGSVILGMVIGTGVGYVGSAVVDVVLRSETEPAPDAVSTRLWVSPLNRTSSSARPPGERSRPAAASAAADGVLLGVTVRW